MPSIIKHYQLCLVRAKVLRHDGDIKLNELFAFYQNNKFKFCEGWMARNMGNVLLNMDDNHLSDAAVWFQKAIEADTRNGVRWQLARDHASYADWFKRKGDRVKASENYQKAIDIFEEGGADGWVNRIQKSLAELA